MSASGGNPRMTELLINQGADVNAPNAQGKTALHYAAGKGHEKVVSVLVQHSADTSVRYHDKTPLELARRAGHNGVISQLQKAVAKT